MFAYIRGQLVKAASGTAYIDVHGVGYRISIPSNLQEKLPQLGQEVQLYTSLQVREDSQTLYGFMQEEEREIFDLLLTVSGIGPKIALALIGYLPLPDFYRAVQERNLVTLSKVPGIGKKTAERLVIELKDKISNLSTSVFTLQATPLINDLRGQKIQDAMSALINLGYHQHIAQKAIQKTLGELPEEVDIAIMITHSLRHLKSNF